MPVWDSASHVSLNYGLSTEDGAAARLPGITMSSEEYRQSDRVNFRVPIEASWVTRGGTDKKQQVETLLVSRNGGVIRLADKLDAGQELLLRRQCEGDLVRRARARVVAEIDKELDGYLYAFAFTEKHPDFWDIEFPSPLGGDEALARLLMECGFCQRREVVYLNELELRSFESRKCIARICKVCEAPAVWIEAQSEFAPADSPTTRAEQEEDRVIPRRNRTRVKARVLACIRRRGFQEEVAVCEDLSKGGIAFRSRNEFPKGTRVEVAVPFTPGAGAIFVPIRIVFSRAIPSAGLYRHGASYIREAVAPVK